MKGRGEYAQKRSKEIKGEKRGYGVDEGDMLPLDLPGDSIDWVSEYPYFGYLIAESGRPGT